MNILCVDKTGTLTEGTMRSNGARDVEGNSSRKGTLYGYLNASYQTGFSNPIDNAIRASNRLDLSQWDEVPYEFVRKRLSILVAHEGEHMMITKGAVNNVLDVCSYAENARATVHLLEPGWTR